MVPRRLDPKRRLLFCPKCRATFHCAPPANCPDCLMDRVEIVPLAVAADTADEAPAK